MSHKLFLILHDIRSAHNVGAMIRTADGAGVSKIYFSGYTQAPAEPHVLRGKILLRFVHGRQILQAASQDAQRDARHRDEEQKPRDAQCNGRRSAKEKTQRDGADGGLQQKQEGKRDDRHEAR